MKPSIRQKLDKLAERFEEVGRLLAEPVNDLLGADDLLLVAPYDPRPAPLGGVAYTATYGKKRAKRFVVVWPDGHTGEDWTVAE